MKNFRFTSVFRMAVAIVVGLATGYGALHFHKVPSLLAKEPPSEKRIKFQEPKDGLNHLVGRDLAPYWEKAGTAGENLQEIRDGILLFVDPSCGACDQVFAAALQVREHFPVILAVDQSPSIEIESYFAYFGAGALPVLHETRELRRILPVDYWPTAILVRDGRVAVAVDGSAMVTKALTETLQDSGFSRKPFQ